MAKLTKEQIEEFKQEEKESDDSSGYMYLAEEVAEAGDKDWAMKLFQKAVDHAEDYYDLTSIAETLTELSENKFAREVYGEAEKHVNNLDEMIEIADSIADEDYLEDKELARVYYKKAEKYLKTTENYIDLGGRFLYLNLGGDESDKKWGMELLEIALKKEKSFNSYRLVANTIRTDDEDRARKLFEKAQELAESKEEYILLASTVNTALDDTDWEEELRQKAKEVK